MHSSVLRVPMVEGEVSNKAWYLAVELDGGRWQVASGRT